MSEMTAEEVDAVLREAIAPYEPEGIRARVQEDPGRPYPANLLIIVDRASGSFVATSHQFFEEDDRVTVATIGRAVERGVTDVRTQVANGGVGVVGG